MNRTRKLADIAIFTAIGLVLNMATFPPVDPFGRISLVYGFCYLAGVFLGPVSGMISAMLADLLGWVLLSHGGPFVPQIMLTNGLMAFAAGILFKVIKWKRKEYTIIIAALICFPLLTLGLSAWGEATMLFNIYPYTLAKSLGQKYSVESPYLMIVMAKSITQPFWIALNVLLSIIIYKRVAVARKYLINSLQSFKAEVEGSKKSEEEI